MDLLEFERVKNMTYWEYCDYLQSKYGIGACDYFNENWSPKTKCKRTKEGLFAHHKAEMYVPQLSDKKQAQNYPFEWQTAKWIVYCDYLEHLLLHIMICKAPEPLKKNKYVGVVGITCYLAPTLFQLYSGDVPTTGWQAICYDRVKNDKDVYMELLKIFFELYCSGKEHNPCYASSLWHISGHGMVVSYNLDIQRNQLKLTETILKSILPYDKEFFSYLSCVFDHTESYESLIDKRDKMIAGYLARKPNVDVAFTLDVPENMKKYFRTDSIEDQLRSLINRGIQGEWISRPLSGSNGFWEAYMYSPEIKVFSDKNTVFPNIKEARKVYPKIQVSWYEKFKQGLCKE